MKKSSQIAIALSVALLSACGIRQTPAEVSQNYASFEESLDRSIPPAVAFCEEFARTGSGDVAELAKSGFSKPPLSKDTQSVKLEGRPSSGQFDPYRMIPRTMKVRTSDGPMGRKPFCEISFAPSENMAEVVVPRILKRFSRAGYKATMRDQGIFDLRKRGVRDLEMAVAEIGDLNALVVNIERR